MACSSACPTKTCESYGQCLRRKNIEVQDVNAHKFNSAQRKEFDNYADARKSGLQPDTTSAADVRKAWKYTEVTGSPYRADL